MFDAALILTIILFSTLFGLFRSFVLPKDLKWWMEFLIVWVFFFAVLGGKVSVNSRPRSSQRRSLAAVLIPAGAT